jgi:hypothetical protein
VVLDIYWTRIRREFLRFACALGSGPPHIQIAIEIEESSAASPDAAASSCARRPLPPKRRSIAFMDPCHVPKSSVQSISIPIPISMLSPRSLRAYPEILTRAQARAKTRAATARISAPVTRAIRIVSDSFMALDPQEDPLAVEDIEEQDLDGHEPHGAEDLADPLAVRLEPGHGVQPATEAAQQLLGDTIEVDEP